jgi:hypothetical protein
VRITFSELIGVGFPIRVASGGKLSLLIGRWPTSFSSVYRALDVAAPSFSNEGIDVAVGDVCGHVFKLRCSGGTTKLFVSSGWFGK